MSRCTHNDRCPELPPCKNEAVREGGYCVEHGCCLCGGVMLADTEDWKVHLCDECLVDFRDGASVERLIDAAFEAGRRWIIGDSSDLDDTDERNPR